MFDSSPGGDLRFEKAGFKLTQEMVDLIGGSPGSPLFDWFEKLCIQGYLAAREHKQEFMAMSAIMAHSSLPCFRPKSMQNFEKRWARTQDVCDAAKHMRDIVQGAYSSITTGLYDK